ncbi:ABC transporter permease [Deinococcus sp. KSM4-11]|uniref:ABC transporter permease n=1 Tax=Deinococcus sp. KSM4-11 TaxID=2568654 RepID=UPI0010A42ADA|nr:ABC transporter permease [Deinococcus sp. KSM4-11]THF85485.1 ABC transporter permease [Deinococcus sp. KSM4-11]
MLRILGHRLLLSVPLLLFVTALTFFLVSLTPGDPAVVILGQNRAPEEYQRLREQLGLLEPVPVQYARWVTTLAHGSLGVSIFNSESVVAKLNSRLGVTLSLVTITALVASVLGVALGIASALRRGVLARTVDVISMLGIVLPSFWIALILVAVFAVRLRWLPAIGYVHPTTSPGGWLRSLVLPVAVLAGPAIGLIAQQTRNAMLDVLERPFIRTLRAGGVQPLSLIYRHALRNAGIPILTVIGLVFIGLLGGTIIAENVFALPGLGGLAVEATGRHDLPVIQGIVLYFTVIVVAVNLLVDLLYAWLNPRIRV